MVSLRTPAVRAVIRWQLVATGALAVVAGLWSSVHGAGVDGALSAAFGGVINVAASLAFYALAGYGSMPTPGSTIRRLVRAEATKISIIVMALWAALSTYESIVPVPFFATFVVTALLPSVAFVVREDPYTAIH